ncbi:hypothetical protein CQW23_08982 [Capsicum baccatum]|uniref:Uncharacterized protein n=1 Tax=Capsicum baccatum TaxID=33114 RepID=A0A2G2XAL9_CAPBA|nr:hypothetical protein CQW23_08982 [Capsicum baccatum]
MQGLHPQQFQAGQPAGGFVSSTTNAFWSHGLYVFPANGYGNAQRQNTQFLTQGVSGLSVTVRTMVLNSYPVSTPSYNVPSGKTSNSTRKTVRGPA